MAAAEEEVPVKRTKLSVDDWIEDVNVQYEIVHKEFEDQFWGGKMALSGDFSNEKLGQTKEAMEAFLRDPERLAVATSLLKEPELTKEQEKILKIFIRTFECYQMPEGPATSIRSSITTLEDTLASARNTMELGYTCPKTNKFVEKSSVGLRTTMRTSDDEATRKAAYEGLYSIGGFVLNNGFVDIVKQRNALARALGYVDFYDYKVTQAEGFNKATLFGILDTLLDGSQGLLEKARAQLVADKGKSAADPWNTGFLMAGSVEEALDPYFPFEKAVEQWGRSFSKLGIDYKGATMTLDLLDRKGKYSNGFCHWPQPAWVKADGSFQPSTTNFTSLADPSAVGSGKTALTTLMHEAGHAAHFANITQRSPLFSQERAPTSVAYAENQSMFLDSLVSDAAWRVRYAKNREGEPLPWDIHEAELRATHPFAVFQLRAMLAVPYFEKRLYEMADNDLTAASIQALADQVELEVCGGPSPRPLLSVPHLISDEASCYYHGYVLAEMSVHQTREFFFDSLGSIVDRPEVGAMLSEKYWNPGNSEMFLELVEGLTGKPLTGAAWLKVLSQEIDALVAEEKGEYDRAVAAEAASAGGDAEDAVELNMHVVIKDGDETTADSDTTGSFLATCKCFEEYIRKRYSQ